MFDESSQTFGPCTARVVKYIAKRAAKNINSLDSQTMVPTATRFGRLVRPATGAWVVMRAIIPDFEVKLDIYMSIARRTAVKLITQEMRLLPVG